MQRMFSLNHTQSATRLPEMLQAPQDERHQSVASTASETVQQQCALPDVVQQVPHLINVLHRKSRSALSGCNTQLRHMLHSWTTVVLIKNQIDLQTLVNGYWPQLAVVVLRKQHFDECWAGYELDNIQLVAVLDLWQRGSQSSKFGLWQGNSKCSVLLVASKVQQQASLAYNSTYAIAASKCLTSRCTDVERLALRQRTGTWGIAQLALIDRHSLVHLELSNSKLEPVDMMYLIDVPLLQIRHLSLSGNDLGPEGIKILVSAYLPELSSLSLSNAELDAAAAKHLRRGDWPNLACLNLCGNHLDDVAMMHIAAGLWPKLAIFSLLGNPISALGFQRLTKGRWSSLYFLTVESTMLSPSTLALLDIHAMPCLATNQKKAISMQRDFANHDHGRPLIWPSLHEVSCWVP